MTVCRARRYVVRCAVFVCNLLSHAVYLRVTVPFLYFFIALRLVGWDYRTYGLHYRRYTAARLYYTPHARRTLRTPRTPRCAHARARRAHTLLVVGRHSITVFRHTRTAHLPPPLPHISGMAKNCTRPRGAKQLAFSLPSILARHYWYISLVVGDM